MLRNQHKCHGIYLASDSGLKKDETSWCFSVAGVSALNFIHGWAKALHLFSKIPVLVVSSNSVLGYMANLE